ncbi:hypothetical protein V2G26_017386 [Clonostachys chloroleuca]
MERRPTDAGPRVSILICLRMDRTRRKWLRKFTVDLFFRYRRQNYVHRPLSPGQIRVLHLRSTKSREIYCTIEHVDVDKAKYVALSYAWGREDRLFELPVCNENGSLEGLLNVTASLGSAIQDVMGSNWQFKTLWIDQICINQHDVMEKQRQVSLMGKIYSNARSVITYLGPTRHTDRAAFLLLDLACDRFITPLLEMNYHQVMSAFQKMEFHISLAPKRTWTGSKASLLNQPRTSVAEDSSWLDLLMILTGPWSKRLWMIQENMLNRNTWVLRGNRIISQNTVLLLAVFILHKMDISERLSPDMDEIIDRLCQLQQIWCRRIRRLSANHLHELLTCFQSAEYQDPRDRIYALLGVANDRKKLGVGIDYLKSPNEVFTKATASMIQTHGLQILTCNFEPLEMRPETLPSWIPSWNVDGSNSGMETRYWKHSPAIKSETSLWFEDGLSVLAVEGTQIGEVLFKFDAWDWNLYSLYESRDLSTASERFNTFIRTLNHVESFIDADDDETHLIMGCTLLASSQDIHDPVVGKQGIITGYRTAVEMIKIEAERNCNLDRTSMSTDDDLDFEDMPLQARHLGKSFISSMSRLKNFTLCTVAGGHACMAPVDTRPGDVVMKMLGGCEVFVLRPTLSDGIYQYVGPAYLYGYMEGEELKDPNWRDKLQVSRII